MPEEEKREKLAKVIRQWNQRRLDLFEISQPDEVRHQKHPNPLKMNVASSSCLQFSRQNLEFHGVMRFHFEDGDGGNVATKCLRVCSSSSALQVIQTLSEKFRPDMKVLMGKCSLFEIHKNDNKPTGEETQLQLSPTAS